MLACMHMHVKWPQKHVIPGYSQTAKPGGYDFNGLRGRPSEGFRGATTYKAVNLGIR